MRRFARRYCDQEATTFHNLDVRPIKGRIATKKNPEHYTLGGVRKFVASLRLLGWAAVSGDRVAAPLGLLDAHLVMRRVISMRVRVH
jgi:hypothetical protein